MERVDNRALELAKLLPNTTGMFKWVAISLATVGVVLAAARLLAIRGHSTAPARRLRYNLAGVIAAGLTLLAPYGLRGIVGENVAIGIAVTIAAIAVALFLIAERVK